MPLAISEEHRLLAGTVSSFLARCDARGADRAMLDAPGNRLPPFWDELARLGWLGIHLPEEQGGSGFGLEELVVILEEFGRAVAPGPFVSSVVVGAVISRAAHHTEASAHLPGLAAGTTVGSFGLGGSLQLDGEVVSGTVTALAAGVGDVLLVVVGDDAALIETGARGVQITTSPNLDPGRCAGRVQLDAAPAIVIPGAGRLVIDMARIVLSAEAVGVARACTEMAAAYAKVREQFGRPIGAFQAVKHHCANMAVATEMATGAVWDAARAAATGSDQLRYAAAVAATLAGPAADLCTNLNTQVHGGVAVTWEHDAHLYVRRATSILAVVDAETAACDVTDLARRGVVRAKAIELPPAAEKIRGEVRALAEGIKRLPEPEQRARIIETGYLFPHWPEPYGRDAGAVEQLVIEEEFAKAGLRSGGGGIMTWIMLTIIQHGSQEQLDRWVMPAIRGEAVWCQLFSEPDAGSDAAGVKTRADRVESGWIVNGQKTWNSFAHTADRGFATVRTDRAAPKHAGITTMAIDMHSDGITTRPIKMPNGEHRFNDVFFTDVFVPDDDVVGPVNGGWTVARATLGNESVSIGSAVSRAQPPALLISLYDRAPERLYGGAARIGRYLAQIDAVGLLHLRRISHAVEGKGPGPEGAMTKLVTSEIGHESASIMSQLSGPDALFMDGVGARSNDLVLLHRGASIAGGTSEIKRNQIGERILGLPRDPLVS